MEDLVAKTVIALEPYLKNAYRCFIQQEKGDESRCFQILGFDILIDEEANCWLMEVNANPSLNAQQEVYNPETGEVES